MTIELEVDSENPTPEDFQRPIKTGPRWLENNAPDEKWGFKLHSLARAPFLLCLTSMFSPYLLLLARLEASPDDGRVSMLGIKFNPTSYVGIYTTATALISAG